MAEPVSDTDESDCSGNWELLPDDGDPEQQAFILLTDATEALRMNHFTVLHLPTCQSTGQVETMPLTEEILIRNGTSTFLTPREETKINFQELDYGKPSQEVDRIEPSSPSLSKYEDKYGSSRESELSILETEMKLQSLEGCQADLSLPLCSGIPSGLSSDCHKHLTCDLTNERDYASEKWWRSKLFISQAEDGQGNTLWSIAVAAAVVGLLFLGHRWHRFRIQNKKLHNELNAKEKKISQLMYQLVKAKECVACMKQIPIITPEHMFQHR